MKKSKNATEAEFCRNFDRFTDWMVRLTPEQRREALAKALPSSDPKAIALLAERMIQKLESDDKQESDGASDTLVVIGPRVPNVLGAALIGKTTERRLLRLAVVVIAICRDLSVRERLWLLMTCTIAAGRAPTPASRVALEAAVWELREIEIAAPEEQTNEVPLPLETAIRT